LAGDVKNSRQPLSRGRELGHRADTERVGQKPAGVTMKTLNNKQTRVLLSTMVLLTVGWFAVPQAGPEDANDGFILFTTDRDNPSIRGMCDPPRCEDIYVMAPDGTKPVRLTNGGGAPTDLAAYSSGGADWSHSKKLIAFQSNRVDHVPQIYLMNLDGTEQQLLVSLPGGAAFPNFSQAAMSSAFTARPRLDISTTVYRDGRQP
jgi:TolB protein